MKNLLITVSGGRSSARMARHIQTHPNTLGVRVCNVQELLETNMKTPNC